MGGNLSKQDLTSSYSSLLISPTFPTNPLEDPTQPTPPATTFNPENPEITSLPPLVQKFMSHNIATGTPLTHTAVEWEVDGSIFLNKWIPFTSKQVTRPNVGYSWMASVPMLKHVFELNGGDFLYENTARVHFTTLLGWVNVVSVKDVDTLRSAHGRLAGEWVLVPSMLVPGHAALKAWGKELNWREVEGTKDVIQVVIPAPDGLKNCDDFTEREWTINLKVDVDTGRVKEVWLLRWYVDAASGKKEFVDFGLACEGEMAVDGCVLPKNIRCGWNWGKENYLEFFRANIVRARLL
eukprot:comp24718_c0_seq1/m.46851 comp24718_c0_seq1/g.46851  ORF comp24718_c0_seq1/g.46851 comp24718_c0_seq1/m.46851 type:complete len:295 (-) comp24718_c0_seq1:191-1075(-)